MVKVILLEVNCPLTSNIGYSHYGEGRVQTERWMNLSHFSRVDLTRYAISALKDEKSQPKE